MAASVLETPDGRYIVVRGRLWRKSNPALTTVEQAKLVGELMDARRNVREAGTDKARLKKARSAVHSAKVGLGERGPVWWTDGTPDFNRHLAKNTPYSVWFKEKATVAEDKNASEAQKTEASRTVSNDKPPAGSDAKDRLIDKSETLNSEALPDSREDGAAPGAG